jgi:hypothetical protein
MKRFLLLVFCFMFLSWFSAFGVAGAYHYDLGPNSAVDLSGTTQNLRIESTLNPFLDSVSFDLTTAGQSFSFPFGNFWTNETWINFDDTRVSNINATVDFGGLGLVNIPGQSFGFSAPFGGELDTVRPFMAEVRSFISSSAGLTPQQIVNQLPLSLVPAEYQAQLPQLQSSFINMLTPYAVNGVIPQEAIDAILTSLPDPANLSPDGFAQGYFVTWNDHLPKNNDGTPDYDGDPTTSGFGELGYLTIAKSPVTVKYYPDMNAYLQIDLSDVFLSGLFWLGPNWSELPVIAEVSMDVPEPATVLLLGPGLLGLAALRRRFRNK